MAKNRLKKIRTERLLSKAELARKARVSTFTINRIEADRPCRPETIRKILLALGLKLSQRDEVFPQN